MNTGLPNTAQTRASVDAGLRGHMQRVYNRMSLGVLVTALTAWFVSSSPVLLNLFLGGPQAYIIMFAPLVITMFGFRPDRMAARQLGMVFFAVAVVYGISVAAIALVFTGESIARAFFVATAMFAGLSIFGYTTRKDAMGSFAVMGMFGLLAASVIGLFFQSTMMQHVIAGVGIVVFAILTAWQTQTLKESYSPYAPEEANSRMAWAAALNLYISFIAMFQYILHFLGQRQQ